MEYSLHPVEKGDAEALVRNCEWPAMKGDPLHHVMYPHIEDHEAEEECIVWAIAMVSEAIQREGSKPMKVCDRDGSPVGFALWCLEDYTPDKVPNKNSAPANRSYPKALDIVSWQPVTDAIQAERKRMIGGSNGVWRLAGMYVNPDHHRRGIGSILMKWGCDVADNNGYQSFVMASPSGMRLYQKFGFEVVGMVEIPNGNTYSMKRCKKAIHVDR